MYQAIVRVHPNDDFSLSVVFEDGAEGILDMKPYLDFGVFKKIKDLDQFRRVRIAFDTVEWECGADLDPEFVRAKCGIVEKT
ncbi:MAG: DUF2442 domain-containing protein [Phycisphaerae bacterium]|jgi:predicted transcriptional regulator|nr:DUF2442 domain-containing protein [Phycisphaerae bacterium]